MDFDYVEEEYKDGWIVFRIGSKMINLAADANTKSGDLDTLLELMIEDGHI